MKKVFRQLERMTHLWEKFSYQNLVKFFFEHFEKNIFQILVKNDERIENLFLRFEKSCQKLKLCHWALKCTFLDFYRSSRHKINCLNIVFCMEIAFLKFTSILRASPSIYEHVRDETWGNMLFFYCFCAFEQVTRCILLANARGCS